jgi:hypothetical protein
MQHCGENGWKLPSLTGSQWQFCLVSYWLIASFPEFLSTPSQ